MSAGLGNLVVDGRMVDWFVMGWVGIFFCLVLEVVMGIGSHSNQKYAALWYSEGQKTLHEQKIALFLQDSFRCNTCQGKPYTECTLGQTLDECVSSWDDAVLVWSGTTQEYRELVATEQLQFN